MTKAQVEKQVAQEELRKMLKPGLTLYTILRRRSSSGMCRHISVVALDADGPREISHLAARALGMRRDLDTGGIVVSGCGMDMGFHLVYELGSVLWPGMPRAGYALGHRWL